MHEEPLVIPNHLGFILDGNRRWAKKHGLPTYEGHLAGYNSLKEVVLKAADVGIKYVSVYSFSTENWQRSEEEVKGIMGLAMRLFKTEISELVKHGIKLVVLGSRDGVPQNILDAMDEAQQKTKDLTRITLAMCFNYGGKREIAAAAQKCINDGLAEITEEALAERMYAPEVPDVDMVVRTSGEQRISNFMLWRVAYSEFYFMDKFWPDMRASDIDGIIKEYNRRNRRFGGN